VSGLKSPFSSVIEGCSEGEGGSYNCALGGDDICVMNDRYEYNALIFCPKPVLNKQLVTSLL
jgi:hypothetical protein